MITNQPISKPAFFEPWLTVAGPGTIPAAHVHEGADSAPATLSRRGDSKLLASARGSAAGTTSLQPGVRHRTSRCPSPLAQLRASQPTLTLPGAQTCRCGRLAGTSTSLDVRPDPSITVER